MAEKKIIAVVGATGAQGGGLVRAILDEPQGGFAARAITRDADSDNAKALARLGAEVVVADVDDVESLKRAFAGAYGAYCVTFFWAHFRLPGPCGTTILTFRNPAAAALSRGVSQSSDGKLAAETHCSPLPCRQA